MTESPDAPPSNAEMARYWSEDCGPNWVRDEVVYELMLAPFNEVLVGAVEPLAGKRVLEVGCGFGSTALALAAGGAKVHGVDISPPMIDRARERAVAAKADATFAVADAQEAELGGPYDAIASRFGVMFFAEPERAFANFARAVRPGGQLAFVCWQTLDRNPWMGSATEVIRSLLADPPPPGSPTAGPFAFGDRAHVEGILTNSGWSDVTISPVETSVHMGGNGGVAGAVDQMLGSSAVKALLAMGDASLRERAAELLARRLAAHVDRGVVRFAASAWLVQARSPTRGDRT